MEYLLDTVGVVRYFTDHKNIGKSAKKIFDSLIKENHHLVISTISLMEILYLSEKNRIPISLQSTLQKIRSSTNYSIIDLTPEIITTAQGINFYELHDRMILATAKWLEIPIISTDERFSEVNEVQTIWD